MAKGADAAARRRRVADLWLCGAPPSQIAAQLKISERTIWRDIAAIRSDLRAAHLATLDDSRARSLAVLRAVQRAAWALFQRIGDQSTNKASALAAILHAERQIAKIEGTATDGLHLAQVTITGDPNGRDAQPPALDLATLQTVLGDALAPYPEAQYAVAAALLSYARPRDDALDQRVAIAGIGDGVLGAQRGQRAARPLRLADSRQDEAGE